VTVPAPARDFLDCFARVTGGARERIFRRRRGRRPRGPGHRGVTRDLVLVVHALVAHRHLQERSGSRDRVHGDEPRQPPSPGPQPVVDRDVANFDLDWFDEPRNVLVVLVADILLEIERTRRANERAHHGVGGFVDPERAGHQPEVQPARNDAQLAQLDRVTIREHQDARIAGRKLVVCFTAGCERMAELHVAVLASGILRGVAACVPKSDGEPVVRRIERVVARITFQIFGDLAFRDRRGHGLPGAQDVDLRHRVAAPVDPQRELAPVEHAVAPQRADPDANPLSHPGPVCRYGSVDRFPARARRSDQASRGRIEIGGAIPGRRLQGEDGGNEERNAHVGLCTDPGEG